MNAAEKLMGQFREIVRSKGLTVEETWDLLRHGSMAHDPPTVSALNKWLSGDRTPNGSSILGILEFVRTHSRKKHQ